jgi:hypothetical protein
LDEIKEDEMGRVCRTRGNEEEEKKNGYGILVREPEGKNSYEELNVDGRIILKFTLKK